MPSNTIQLSLDKIIGQEQSQIHVQAADYAASLDVRQLSHIMNKNAVFASIGCFILGVVLGTGVTYVVAKMHYFKVTVDAMLMVKQAEYFQSAGRALTAYQEENRNVAIYALSQHLLTMEEAAKLPETPFTPQESIAGAMVLIHGRLAKLYTEAGQTNLSEQHVARAIQCSKKSGGHPTITNEVGLVKFVANMDSIMPKMGAK